MVAPIVPGAILLTADQLATDQVIEILTGGPRSAITTLQNVAQFLELANDVQNTAITTAGAGTLTAAAIVGGLITRTGPTADYTDTTATGAQILVALGADTPVGATRLLTIKNMVAFTETLAAGASGVTLAGLTAVPGLSVGTFLLKQDTAGAFTLTGISTTPLMNLPVAKLTTGTAATFAAGDITGANWVDYINNASNATLTTRTATQMFADIPNCQIGFAYKLAIRNLNATGATLTAADASVTLSGTMTIAQNATRNFEVVFTSGVACTITSMGGATAAA